MSNMRDRLIELIKLNQTRDSEELADYLIANGVIVLPCKAGDILYEITERRIKSHWVKCIVRRVVLSIEVGLDSYISAKCGTTISIPLRYIGKTVFLTREEAEQALKENNNA